MEHFLKSIASNFQIDGSVISVKKLGEGFINDTYIVETEDKCHNYILQRKNRRIFTDVPAMMDNILRVTNHIKSKVEDPLRQSLTITTTTSGELFYKDDDDEYWAASLFIDNTVAYNAAKTAELAYQGGKGIGRFQSMLADFNEPLADILPGFHNMRYRFQQWDAILAKDSVGRKKECKELIEAVESRRTEMMALWEKYENGIIPTRVTHNDTKINNILFDIDGNVLCVIDLDTVLSSTCLNDFGDAIRSYTNSGAEDDADLNNVEVDMNIFRGYTQGYLSEAIAFLNEEECKNLAFSAKYITFEQVLRFLMDYIDGDNYYKIKYADHNLVRTKAQYKLLQSMERNYQQMCNIVNLEIERLK